MPKLKSAKWAKNYQKGRIDWWTESDHMWNQVYLLDDADDYIDTLATGAGGVWGGKPPVKDETQLPSNWRAHLAQRRQERKEDFDRVRARSEDAFYQIGKFENYREYAEKRGLPEHHIRAVIKEMGGDIVKIEQEKQARKTKAARTPDQVLAQRRADNMGRGIAALPIMQEIKKKQHIAAMEKIKSDARRKLKRDEARYNTLHSYYYEQTWRYVEFMGMIFPTGEIKDVD